MVHKLCGRPILKNVIIVTMWNDDSQAISEACERELRNNFSNPLSTEAHKWAFPTIALCDHQVAETSLQDIPGPRRSCHISPVYSCC